jgi:alpha-tubulin suppressor-like RCC1 family protein
MHKFIKTSLQFLVCCFVLFQGDVQARCCPGTTTTLAGGNDFSLALRDNGTIWAWGLNNLGQVGDGSTDPNTDTPGQVVTTPARCQAFLNAVAISAGGFHSLAARIDGTVWGWGDNSSGQLGTGFTGGVFNIPVQVSTVPGFTDIVNVAAGFIHSLALKSDGTVWAWGNNGSGRLGNGITGGIFNTPGQVVTSLGGPALTDVVAIAAGQVHSLALKSDGTVWAWGNNSVGQLGNGSISPSNVPVQVLNLPADIVAIAAGFSHSLALDSSGQVWAWGLNSNGQLGNGTTGGSSLFPNLVVTSFGGPIFTDVVAIAAGGLHSLALKSDGTVWDWGSNSDGQLGNGSFTDSNVPVQVNSLTNVIDIAGGAFHSLALKNDNTIWAWGDNSFGELGIGVTGGNSPVPVKANGIK